MTGFADEFEKTKSARKTYARLSEKILPINGRALCYSISEKFFEDIREIWGKKKRTYGTDKEF